MNCIDFFNTVNTRGNDRGGCTLLCARLFCLWARLCLCIILIIILAILIILIVVILVVLCEKWWGGHVKRKT